MKRLRLPELMDDPAIEPRAHAAALHGLRRLNALSGTWRTFWNRIRPRLANSSRPLRLLDVATGSGDLPIRLSLAARAAGLKLECHGCDVSRFALRCAEENAQRSAADVTFLRLDVLADALPDGYDIVTNSLFLHHFDPPDVRVILSKLKAAPLVYVSDLIRSQTGYALAWVATRGLTNSPVVQIDGLRSVNAAYTPEEFRALALEAGLENATVRTHFPQRMLLAAERA